MEKQTLEEQIFYTCKLFMRIVIFALFGVIFSYACDIDPYKCYKVIIGCALIGAFIGVFEVLKKVFNDK